VRSLLKFALFLGLLAGAAWFYGSRQPREHVATSVVTLVAPADTVYRLIRDIPSSAVWWDDVKTVRRLTSKARESWEQDMGARGKLQIQITSEVPGERLVTTILNDDQKDWGGKWTYSIRSTAEGTQVRITEEGWVEKPLFRVMSQLMGGPHKSLDSYLRSLGAHFGETVTPRHGSGG
jgi:uncharacterized protein YndB with AHSA1/START domain